MWYYLEVPRSRQLIPTIGPINESNENQREPNADVWLESRASDGHAGRKDTKQARDTCSNVTRATSQQQSYCLVFGDERVDREDQSGRYDDEQ